MDRICGNCQMFGYEGRRADGKFIKIQGPLQPEYKAGTSRFFKNTHCRLRQIAENPRYRPEHNNKQTPVMIKGELIKIKQVYLPVTSHESCLSGEW